MPDTDKETLPALLEDFPDAELEARFGLVEAIVTSQSQTILDFSGINLDNNDTTLSSEESEEEASIRFSCQKCKYDDKSAAALLAHEKASHNDMFVCQICESVIHGRYSMNKHMAEHQAKDSLCEVCGVSCTNISNLQKHILAKHCMQSSGQVAELLTRRGRPR